MVTIAKPAARRCSIIGTPVAECPAGSTLAPGGCRSVANVVRIGVRLGCGRPGGGQMKVMSGAPSATMSAELNAAVLDRVPVGVLVVDPSGRVVLANPAAVALVPEVAPDQVVGGHLADLPAGAVLRAADAARRDRTIARAALPDGRTIEAAWHQVPLDPDRDDGGRVHLLTLTDVTSSVRVREQARRHNRELAELAATKTELVAVLLHELRTPLTTLSTAVECLTDPADPATGAAYDLNGIGIPPAALSHLFQRRFNAANAVASGLAGPGLGLAVAKAIADAHRATLVVTSGPAGTVATITLP